MLGIWSIAASMPASDGSAAPRMSLTLRARLPRASSAIACSSPTMAFQSSCGPALRGGVVGATGMDCGGVGCAYGVKDWVGICAVGGSAGIAGMTGIVGSVGLVGAEAGASALGGGVYAGAAGAGAAAACC